MHSVFFLLPGIQAANMAGSGTNTCTQKLKMASNAKMNPAHLLESWMKSTFNLIFLFTIHTLLTAIAFTVYQQITFSSREISCVYVSCAWKCMNLMLDASFISVMMLTWGNSLQTEHSWHINDGTHMNNPISWQHHTGWKTVNITLAEKQSTADTSVTELVWTIPSAVNITLADKRSTADTSVIKLMWTIPSAVNITLADKQSTADTSVMELMQTIPSAVNITLADIHWIPRKKEHDGWPFTGGLNKKQTSWACVKVLPHKASPADEWHSSLQGFAQLFWASLLTTV